MNLAHLHQRGFRISQSLTCLVLALDVIALFAVPALLRDHAFATAGVTLALLALLSNTRWSLIHEAIHRHLFPSSRANELAGRLLSIAHGASFSILRAGHLLHHRYSRTALERTEVFDPARARLVTCIPFYLQLCGGLYLLEVVTTLAAWLPLGVFRAFYRRYRDSTVAGLIAGRLCEPRVRRHARIDALAMVTLYGVAALVYGKLAWVLAIVISLRAVLISVADNSYHYGTELDQPRSAMNVRAPRWASALLLNFNLHGVHHRAPQLAWFQLSARFDADRDRYAISLVACLVRQWRGPLRPDELPLR